MQKSLKRTTSAAKKASTTTTKKSTTHRPVKSRAFRPTHSAQSSRRDKFAEAVLNIIPPKKTRHSLRSTIQVSAPGDVMPTGALSAPVGNTSHSDGYAIDKVVNVIPKAKGLSKEQNAQRALFFNTFPRQSVSPAGHILQTQYTNYSVYRGVVDYGKRLPGVDVKISVKERVDYTDRYDSRWYAEAMARPRARVEMNIKHFTFLTQMERDIFGEILGPRYNWHNGKIVVSVGNLREIHASINRCFQLVHEAAFRAIEIAPTIQAASDKDNAVYQKAVRAVNAQEKLLNTQLKKSPQQYFTRAAKQPQQFLTADNEHFIPYNPEFTMEDHLKYIPRVTLDKMLLAETIPPGMAAALKRRKDFDQAALALDPKLDPEQIVSPGIEPYSYMDRATMVAQMMPLTRELSMPSDSDAELDTYFSIPTPSRSKQMLRVMDSEYEPEDAELLAYASGAVMEGEIHPLDYARAVHALKIERSVGDVNLEFLNSDRSEDPDGAERWKETQFAPR